MKLIFPLLTISLILGTMRYPISTVSASAQQHHSFATARNLYMEQYVSVTIAANASEYCYFHSLHSQKDTESYQITVSNSSSISISAYNDQGNMVSFKTSETSGSTWTGSLNCELGNERFFLVLQNLSKKDVSIQLLVQNQSVSTNPPSRRPYNGSTGSATKKPRKTSRPKNCSTKKPSQKPRKTSRPKTFSSKKPQNSFAPKNIVDPPCLPKKSGQSSKKYQRAFPHNTEIPKDNLNKSSAKPSPTNATRPKTDTKQPNHTLFRSNSIVSSHFVRMTEGYSVSAFELLPIYLPENQFTLESLTPDFLSLQNNIIYAKKSGLGVLRIQYYGHTTTCTLYIQKKT